MAHLCLGVERRQELLANLVQSDSGVCPPPSTGLNGRQRVVTSVYSAAPSVKQARGVIDPLERALQIYTDMNNASQAAACHYQVGAMPLVSVPGDLHA